MFYNVDEVKELKTLINFCKKQEIEYKVIGNGSNILFSDEKYPGLVIYLGNDFSLIKNKKNVFKCQAGALLSKLIIETTRLGYQGVESLIGIPASIGGAVYSNAGCNGVTISDYLVSITCLLDGKIKKIKKKDLYFSYRDSIFKRDDFIILEVKFKFPKGDKIQLLKDMKNELKNRKEKQPSLPSIGCIFKNGENFFAGKLIEECGLKGKTIGGVRVSEMHANIIENFDNGTSQNVKDLIDLIKYEVLKQKNIKLEEEIIIW